MSPTLHPWQLLSVLIASFLNEHQQRMIDYLWEKNPVLREQFGEKRIRLRDDQKRRLAVLGKALGRKVLSEVCWILTPDTILRWHRRLIAEKYDGSEQRRSGRPHVMGKIRHLVLRMATENTARIYERIEGELRKLGHRVAQTTVANILRDHVIEPAPDRSKRTTGTEFIRTHWESIAAIDIFTVETWTTKGLTRFHVLFVMDLSTRRVVITGASSTPHGTWIINALRNMLDDFDGFLSHHTHLIHDRDPLFTGQLTDMLASCGIEMVKLPLRSPNLNAYAERFVRSIGSECLNRIIPIGERHLRRTIQAYAEHYNCDRPHQGMGNERLVTNTQPAAPHGKVVCDERLGGLLRTYQRAA